VSRPVSEAWHKEPLRIGVTGGIASGKSTVADMFAELGAVVIDTDLIARDVVAPGQPAVAEIAIEFGTEYVDETGMLDRARMRERIFSDDTARARLEAILHPRIRDETLARAKAGGGPYQLIVVPLLVGSPLVDFVDRVLVVDCDEAIQVARLLARDAGTESEARRILATQASREERLAIADDVIDNAGPVDATRRQVQRYDRRYRDLARTRSR